MIYTVYLDCCATSPLESEVLAEISRYQAIDYGNSGSRTHEYGATANRAVETARRQVAAVVGCEPNEVVFTSGATESDNLATLGLFAYGVEVGKKHIISTQIEHKAILEPLDELARRGFEITLIPVNKSGRVDAAEVLAAIRDDTLLVSIMHANNETGVIQPIPDIAVAMQDHEAFLHTDAAQTFGKLIPELRNPRIDMISLSGHKIYGPKGIGALVARRRQGTRLPLRPLMFGGGQEKGLRPGTMPVPLIAGLGKAAELALRDHQTRLEKCLDFRAKFFQEMADLPLIHHGNADQTLAHVANVSFGDIDSEALMLALKDIVAISNGSACTSASYSPSHVLTAMQFASEEAETATRWSWCHLTEDPDWKGIRERIQMLL